MLAVPPDSCADDAPWKVGIDTAMTLCSHALYDADCQDCLIRAEVIGGFIAERIDGILAQL